MEKKKDVFTHMKELLETYLAFAQQQKSKADEHRVSAQTYETAARWLKERIEKAEADQK